MKLTPEDLKKLDDQVKEIGKYLGMEFDQEYADRHEQDWNYWVKLKNGDKRISFNTGDYLARGRFIIRGEFPKDKKGQVHAPYNATWPQISIAINRGAEKIAKAIQSRLMPEYERQLTVALETNLKSDAYHDGRLEALRAVTEYFGQPPPRSDDEAIHPGAEIGIYKIEAVSEGLKFDVSCTIEKALQIFEILKGGKDVQENMGLPASEIVSESFDQSPFDGVK